MVLPDAEIKADAEMMRPPILRVMEVMSCAVYMRHLRLVDAAQLAGTCHDLRKVHLSLFIEETRITFKWLKLKQRERLSMGFFKSAISQLSRTSRVRSINLHGCRNLSGDVIKTVAEKCPVLTALDVYNCWQLTNDGIRAIATNCPYLVSLNVGFCDNLTDDAIMAIAANCSLKLLDVSGNRRLTDDAFKAIAANCPGLTVLRVPDCDEITDASIIDIARNCPLLTEICVNYCRTLTDDATKAIAAKCPSLKGLDIAGCGNLTE